MASQRAVGHFVSSGLYKAGTVSAALLMKTDVIMRPYHTLN